MKTKNFLLTGALLIMALFSVNGVMAAEPTNYVAGQTSDNVKVNLIFKPIQSIQVNPNQKEINFVYDSPEDYATGLSEAEKIQTKTDHLTVYHSGPFDVKVASSGFKKGGDGDLIENDHVKVIASKGSNITDRENFVFTSTSLSAGSEKQFFSSTGGGMGMKFNVTYEHDGWKAEDTYIDFTNGTMTSTYTADVTYTIVSQ